MKLRPLATLAPAALLPATATAQTCDSVGYLELQAIVDLMGSPLGIGLGLLVAVWGIWTWFVSQNMGRGIILLALGVLITCFPALYNGLRMDTYDIAKELGGSGKKTGFLIYAVDGDCGH